MSFPRSVAVNALRQSILSSSFSRTLRARNFAHLPLQPRPQLSVTRQTRVAPIRYSSSQPAKSQDYDFKQMKAFSETPTQDRVIIDVREPSELDEGFIPTARNLPIKSQPDALFLPEDEFEERFGFEKPGKEQEVVFYCRAGVRATAAARLALQQGYERVGEYKGSWLDWEKNGGSDSKA